MIDSDLVPLILEYQGDRGLKGALDSLRIEEVRMPVKDEGAITDADTKEDYEHLVEIHNSRLIRSGVKVWLMKEKSFFGPGTVTLLRQIDAMGSVREACKCTGISYSKGWTILHAAETELGYPIVERKPGGKYGGVAFVTEAGKQLMTLYEQYEKRVGEAADRIFEDVFSDTDLF